MNSEAEWRDNKYRKDKPCPSFLRSLLLFLRIVFYRPVWGEEEEYMRKRVRWIFVRFSAWHYAGSDKLWAGLVIRLFKAIQKDFGELFLSVYKATQHPYSKKVQVGVKSNWKVRKFLCVPLWLVVVIAVALSVAASIVLYRSGFQIKTEGKLTWTTFMESTAIGILGLPSVVMVRFFYHILKNLFYDQVQSVMKKMNCTAVSDQLGFMSKVKKEVTILVDFIHFMEVFEKRKIRVVLEVTHLDRCSPDKVIQTLEAMNILVAGENIPFVSILAVDPRVMVSCVESSFWYRGSKESGYDFLNQMVTLPFSVPEMCTESKRRVFESLVKSHLEILSPESGGTKLIKRKGKTDQTIELETGKKRDESTVPFISKSDSGTLEKDLNWEMWANKVKELTKEALETVYSAEKPLHGYLRGSSMHMRRIINSVRVSVIVLEALHGGRSSAQDIAAWVVLANLWPCRLSWILQCLEDHQQKADIDPEVQETALAKPLWDIFQESSLELHALRSQLESVLAQDGDPELFEKFLRVDFRFTVRDVRRFTFCTINLDHSIRHELARVREGSSLKVENGPEARRQRAGPTAYMSTDDICKEMEKLNIPVRCQQLLTENRLDGAALVNRDSNEIRQILQMTPREWMTFHKHFLGDISASTR
ncbi:NTPase KAP family P-loop domain-containing protein 1-like [Chanos chanos]|uniref:NTPase KAP family P-loop domain-containing protein 1-like n=1 Tax=Chanos chanos TaxID=29144 RepID=A0A6J2VP33_CHACN|nr:NTPase KAP family P-loop domain-containing protein 1-like [Chanos chanos]